MNKNAGGLIFYKFLLKKEGAFGMGLRLHINLEIRLAWHIGLQH